MTMDDKQPIVKERDLLLLLNKLWRKRKFIIKLTLLFFFIGIVLAFTSVKLYTVSVMVSPEQSNTSSISGSLGSLASLAGIDFSASSSDAIYPLIYPEIIESLPFLCEIMNVHVIGQNGCVDTTYAYYQAHLKKSNWVGRVIKYPKKAIKRVIKSLTKKEYQGNPYEYDPYRLSENQMIQIESLLSSISVFVDKKTEVITISFIDPDPEIAATMASEIEHKLEVAIIDYRTKKLKVDCEYSRVLCQNAKEEYELAQNEYASYVDRNRNISQEKVMVELKMLEADRDFKNTMYTQCAQQYQLAKARLQEQTPVFSIIQPASVPSIPSSIRRLYQLALYTILGFVISICCVLFGDSIKSVLNKVKISDN